MAEGRVTRETVVVQPRPLQLGSQLSDDDKTLLNLLQSEFALDPEPFSLIAERLGVDEGTVLERTAQLRSDGIIRELSAIFDTRALGYRSMLVAAKVDKGTLRESAEVINAHPGVSHNYERNHDFNLWFTIAVSPNSSLGLEKTLEILAEQANVEAYRMLPTLRLFKIQMNLDMKGGAKELSASQELPKPRLITAIELSDDDIAVIRAVQGNLPTVSRPYDSAAAELGWPTSRLLEHLQGMADRGVLRRVAAILFHRKAGFMANGMGVWNVPADRIAEIGPRMAAVRGISHCYERPTYPDWPYSVFTMAHGRNRGECDEILKSISDKTGIDDYRTLYSCREFKKIRIHYFHPAFDAWEAKYSGAL